MNLFLSPVIEEINSLYQEGMQFSTMSLNITVCSVARDYRLCSLWVHYSTCTCTCTKYLHVQIYEAIIIKDVKCVCQ